MRKREGLGFWLELFLDYFVEALGVVVAGLLAWIVKRLWKRWERRERERKKARGLDREQD